MQRIILLGASNLSLGFPLLVESLRATFGKADVLAAHGHGRSYGRWSRVLGRRLPGIRESGLWETLSAGAATDDPPLGLITDVGNDLLYGASPATILEWVETCVGRLSESGAAVTLTGVPLESVQRMSATRYHATRLCFFPSSGPDWTTMRGMIEELDGGLREIAERHQGAFVEPRRDWYGVDPIHVRRGRRAAAWQEILSTWPVEEVVMQPPAWQRASFLCRLRPQLREMFGRRQVTAQPVLDEGDLRVSLY